MRGARMGGVLGSDPPHLLLHAPMWSPKAATGLPARRGRPPPTARAAYVAIGVRSNSHGPLRRERRGQSSMAAYEVRSRPSHSPPPTELGAENFASRPAESADNCGRPAAY